MIEDFDVTELDVRSWPRRLVVDKVLFVHLRSLPLWFREGAMVRNYVLISEQLWDSKKWNY